MVTIKKIAQMSKVSIATVSNVLNGIPGTASEAKTREILDLARELNYTPNMIAKSLKQRKTNTIGIITEDLTVFNTPEIVDGIDSCCKKNGYDTILANMRLFKLYRNDFTDTPGHHELLNDTLRNMSAKQVEGIVYVGYHCREMVYFPSQIQVPFVYAYCYSSNEVLPSVIYDDQKAAFDVTELLIHKGHRKIGVICGPADSYHTQERLRGFNRALTVHNIKPKPELLVYGDWERQSGYNLAGILINSGVSAIFSFNDLMASGVYERAAEMGLQIGKDLALFGFDNRDISQGYIPALSTVAPPLHEIGSKCAEIIFAQMKQQWKKKKRICLPCIIHERNSIAAKC